MLKAAADTGFDVGSTKGSHLPQLPRDLDGFMKQQTELPLVTRVARRRYLAEEVCGGEDGREAVRNYLLVNGERVMAKTQDVKVCVYVCGWEVAARTQVKDAF